VIVNSLANGLLFLSILMVRPHLCSINWAYDLLVTFLCFVFPIVYAVVPVNPDSAFGFPWAALGIGVIAIVASLICEFRPRQKSPYADVSHPDHRETANGNEADVGFCGCCFVQDDRPGDGEPVMINDIDLRDIRELESAAFNANPRDAFMVNSRELRRLTTDVMEAMSQVCTREDLLHLCRAGCWLTSIVLVCAGWYFGTGEGVHDERLSIQC
jgi:Na+/melibiose symporter-like transporter